MGTRPREDSDGVRAFSARSQANWPLRIGSAICVAVVLSALLWLSLRRTPAPAETPQDGAGVSPPAPVADNAPAQSTAGAAPRAAVPEVVRVPLPKEPPGPFALKAENRYNLNVRVSSVSHGTKAGTMSVAFEVLLYANNDKTLMRSLGEARVSRLVLDSGTVIACNATAGFSEGGAKYWGHVRTEVPDDTRWLREVEGSVTINHAKKRETLVWEDPLTCRGQARTAGAITITLVDYQQDATSARAVIQVKAPPTRHMGTRDEEFFLGGGKYRRPFAGNGGPAPGGADQWNLSTQLNNLTPKKTLEADIVSEVEAEDVPFHLVNVPLPLSPEPPAAPKATDGAAPRHATVQYSAQGFTLWLQSVTVIAGDRPGVSIMCMAAANAGTEAHFANIMAMQPKAVYDTGATAAEADKFASAWAEHWVPMHKGRLYFAFSFPPPPANALRFSSLSGIYRAFVADETKTAEFTLTKPGENVTEPLAQGPVALLSVTCAKDTAVVTCAVDSKATLTGKNWPPLVGIAAADEHGASLKQVDSGQAPPGDRVVVTSTFSAGQGKLARLVASYPVKGGIREIPFEFKEVDLPRKAGKIEFTAPEF